MMKFKSLAGLVCALTVLSGQAYSAGSDELAGEQEPVKKVEVKPSPQDAEGSTQISLTKSAASLAPSFELPEAVVTGSGERKAASSRPDLSVMLDTSGGIKANPSEANASKDQLGAVGQRQSFGKVTETVKPSYGQVRALYGLANTFDGSAVWGQEYAKAYYLLQGEGAFSNGGPREFSETAQNKNSNEGVFARGGWRQDGGQQWSADLAARWRDRVWTRNPIAAPELSMDRALYGMNLAYDGATQSEIRHDIKVSASSVQVTLPGIGTADSETLLGAAADLEKEFLTSWKRVVVSSSFYAQSLSLDQGRGNTRSNWLGGGLLMARLEPWSGARLGLGVSLDLMTDKPEDYLVAPRAEFDQRLGRSLSLWLRFAPKLEMPTLAGVNGLFEKDPVIPGLNTTAAKDLFRLEGGISTSLQGNIDLEIKGFVRQNRDAVELDDPYAAGFWTSVNVPGMRSAGADIRLSAPLGENLKEHAMVSWQGGELLDSPGLGASFFPAWQYEEGLDWAWGPWKAFLSAIVVGERQGRLLGGDLMPATVDLRFGAEYAFNENFSLMVEARNLLSQPVQEFSGYNDPEPFAGLGATYQF